MNSVPETPRTYKPVAKRATLYTDLTLIHAIHGVALRMGDGHVYFNDDMTGRWIELVDADLPRIILHGQEDLRLCRDAR